MAKASLSSAADKLKRSFMLEVEVAYNTSKAFGRWESHGTLGKDKRKDIQPQRWSSPLKSLSLVL